MGLWYSNLGICNLLQIHTIHVFLLITLHMIKSTPCYVSNYILQLFYLKLQTYEYQKFHPIHNALIID